MKMPVRERTNMCKPSSVSVCNVSVCNALSNFVTDAPRLVGFDPFVRFVDYIEQRAAVPALMGTRG